MCSSAARKPAPDELPGRPSVVIASMGLPVILSVRFNSCGQCSPVRASVGKSLASTSSCLPLPTFLAPYGMVGGAFSTVTGTTA